MPANAASASFTMASTSCMLAMLRDESTDGTHYRFPRAGEHSGLPPRQDPRPALAFSTNLANAGLSSTAMSASTLRSTATAAFFSPFMNRL